MSFTTMLRIGASTGADHPRSCRTRRPRRGATGFVSGSTNGSRLEAVTRLGDWESALSQFIAARGPGIADGATCRCARPGCRRTRPCTGTRGSWRIAGICNMKWQSHSVPSAVRCRFGASSHCDFLTVPQHGHEVVTAALELEHAHRRDLQRDDGRAIQNERSLCRRFAGRATRLVHSFHDLSLFVLAPRLRTPGTHSSSTNSPGRTPGNLKCCLRLSRTRQRNPVSGSRRLALA